MLVLKRVIENPLSLRAWFPPDQRLGTIFLPDVVDIPVGQEICVWLVLSGLHVDLYLLGTVLFRRLKAVKGNPGLAAGSGLGLRPGHVAELGFLQKLLTHGTGPIAMRRYTRTPILVPWEAKVVIPHLRMWSPATLTEISLGGARIDMDMMPVHEGALVKMELPWHSGAVHELELAWFRMADGRVRAGLSRPLGSTISDTDWEELVARAMSYFRGRVRET